MSLNDILSQPENKAANGVYVALSVSAYIMFALAIVFPTAFLAMSDTVPSTPNAPSLPFLKFLTAVALILGPMINGIFLMAIAQLLRYVVAIQAKD